MSRYIESTKDFDFSECGLQALEVSIREEAYPIIERNFEKLAYCWIMCMYLKEFALGSDLMGIYEWLKNELFDVMIVLSYRCPMKPENGYASIEDGTLRDILVHVSEKYANRDRLRDLMESYNPMIGRVMRCANYPVKRDDMETIYSAFISELETLLGYIGRRDGDVSDYLIEELPVSRAKERLSAKEICEQIKAPACCGLMMLDEKENELRSICTQKPSFKQAKKENGEWTFPKWAIREYVKRNVKEIENDRLKNKQEQSFVSDFNFPFATMVHGKVDVEPEPMTRKQEQYIQHICNYLDMDFPNVATKDDACAWLEEHVQEYELEIIKDEAFMWALHENAGDRGD